MYADRPKLWIRHCAWSATELRLATIRSGLPLLLYKFPTHRLSRGYPVKTFLVAKFQTRGVTGWLSGILVSFSVRGEVSR